MTGRLFVAAVTITWGLSVVIVAQQAQDLYQQALIEEHATGDLGKAIALFRQSAAAAGADRGLAARALVRAAGAYEKQGRTPEAATLYADVIRMYPEQRAAVTAARERLNDLHRHGPAQATPAKTGRSTDVSAAAGPMFERYCVRCHNATAHVAGLDLTALNQHDVASNPAAWEKLLRRLLARRDPPPDLPRPEDASYRTLIAALQPALDAAYPATGADDAERIDAGELARRLAVFIWNAAPDAQLIAAASTGRLRDPVVLNQQVARMLRDPRSARLADGFFTDWFSLDRLRPAGADRSRFPAVEDELLQAMAAETRLFLDDQVRGDHDAIEIWTADYTFLNARLARHYGVPGVTGDDFRRIVWSDPRRAGLLGQAAILTAWSMPTRTSPTQRGRFVLSRFFGIDAPNPPANVPAMAETPANGPGAAGGPTMRDRLRAHKINPSCTSCHAIMDPVGLALENFDLTGAWRSTDGGAPIDASGTFADGTRFDGPAGLRAALLHYREAYYSTLAQRLLAYALNRRGGSGHVYDYEMPSVREIVRRSAAGGHRWSSLIAGVAASTPFQMTHVVP